MTQNPTGNRNVSRIERRARAQAVYEVIATLHSSLRLPKWENVPEWQKDELGRNIAEALEAFDQKQLAAQTPPHDVDNPPAPYWTHQLMQQLLRALPAFTRYEAVYDGDGRWNFRPLDKEVHEPGQEAPPEPSANS